MKKNNIFYLFTVLFILGFYSCANDETPTNNNDQKEGRRLISVEELNKMANEIANPEIVYQFNNQEDIYIQQEKLSEIRELELLAKGYTKIEPFDDSDDSAILTRAPIQRYTKKIHPLGTRVIEGTMFKSKFSNEFCNSLNAKSDPTVKLSPSKTYLCVWRDAGTYHTKVGDQQAGLRASPHAAFIPRLKMGFTTLGYSERGYEVYESPKGQIFFDSHQVEIICEDVKHTTTALDIYLPEWDTNIGYEINYSIRTN